MIRRLVLAGVLLLSLGAEDAAGQGAALRRERIAQERGVQRREQLEQRLRTGVARVVKQRIGLTDEQMSRLAQSNGRFDVRRRELVQAERARRVELRRQILSGSSANQDRIAESLDQLLELQRRRIDLQIEEQRDFATFMTPMQRARYVALQEQLRRRVEGIRTNRKAAQGSGE